MKRLDHPGIEGTGSGKIKIHHKGTKAVRGLTKCTRGFRPTSGSLPPDRTALGRGRYSVFMWYLAVMRP